MDMPQRLCECMKWHKFRYVLDNANVSVGPAVLEPHEVNAACNTTIVLAQMVIHGKLDPGCTP